jgi:hypothetical protein
MSSNIIEVDFKGEQNKLEFEILIQDNRLRFKLSDTDNFQTMWFFLDEKQVKKLMSIMAQFLMQIQEENE